MPGANSIHRSLQMSRAEYILTVMAYSAQAVANYFLHIADEIGEGIDPLKMQKLVYFAHGWHLALQDAPLLRDSVEAWQYGPVIPALYHEFKQWGNNPIRRPATRLDPTGTTLAIPTLDSECVWDNADAAKAVIRRVWEVYSKFTGLQLSAMTHQPNSPWAQTRALHPGKRDVDIPDEAIKAFFKARVQSGQGTAPAA